MTENAFLDTNIFLYSEDLQHGFVLDHLTIVNPFRNGDT